MAPFYGRPFVCFLLLSFTLSSTALPSCDLQRPSRLCQLVMEHIEQSEKGSLQSSPRSKEVNLGGDQDEHLLQSLSALLKESRRGSEEKVVEKRRNHNDNDPGHVFLRFGRQTG